MHKKFHTRLDSDMKQSLSKLVPSRPNSYEKTYRKIIVLAQFHFVKFTKQILYTPTSFACSLANRDKPVAATLQRKCPGGTLFVILTKVITKFRRVTSTPDPDTFEKYCHTFPTSIAVLLQSKPTSWQKVICTPPICITIRLPLVSR